MSLPVKSRFDLRGDVDVPMRYMRVVLEFDIAFDDPTPRSLVTLQDGDIVTRLWSEVTTTYDAGTVGIGDGADDDGFALFNCGDANSDIDPSVLGYKLIEDDSLGAYLWDSANGHRRHRIYSTSDSIDVVRTGAPTQGEMKLWMEILRLK